ncbi:hypothetical protein [Brachyspira catarrhinii]|uniref:Uncharacterized protein n=1 Tax=Brachyspira catarrhinii TaxID=2528966 RepID=A0ABY2TRN7_9SPIR|nr:hypothetical protein [Brachyspira catarrhinii]TKZ35093.1 hypothetical protein EZH24_07060 [Brachyspira catarrhinii]
MKEENFKLSDCNIGKQVKKIRFSKVFLIALCILGLIVSYSCQRRRTRSPYTPSDIKTNNRQPTPTGTFSISQADSNNTTNFIVKTTNTVGEIKIGFVSANDYPYTVSYEIEDEDKTEANRITTADTKYTNDILTIEESGLNKIRNLDSSTNFATKNIAVKFTFTATDTNLASSVIADFPVIVTLTHAQTFDSNEATNTFIETALKKGSELEEKKEESGKITGGYSYCFTNGTLKIDTATLPLFTFEITNSIYTNKSDTSGSGITESSVAKSLLKELADKSLKVSDEVGDSPIPEISKSVFSKEATGDDKKSYSLTYKVTWEDIYDLSETEITIKFVSVGEDKFTDDAQPTPTPPETTRSRFRF